MDTFWSNVMVGIISGVLSGLLVSLVGLVVNEMITRPKLKYIDNWTITKRVRKIEGRKIPVFSPFGGAIPVTIYSASSTGSGDENDITTKIGDFDFYGVTIKNLDDPNVVIHRRVAEITRTTLLFDDSKEIECRWWSRDYSEVDKLFLVNGFNIEDRRKVNISSGTSEHLVIASRLSGSSVYSLFDITSDVEDNFWAIKNQIPNFPRYAKLRIFTTSNSTEIKLEFSLDSDIKKGLLMRELKEFPNTVVFKE